MRIVSPLLKRVVYPSLAKAGVFRRSSCTGLATVTYHGIRPAEYAPIEAGFDGNLIDAETFRKHLVLLKKNYDVVSPEDVRAWCENAERNKLPSRAVLITCDDGLLNNLTDMLPVLQQEKTKCLLFVTGASAGDKRDTLWYEDLFLIFFRAPAGYFEISTENVTISGDLGEPEKRRALWWSAVHLLSQVDAEERSIFLGKARHDLAPGLPGSPVPTVERRFGLLVRLELLRLVAAGMTIGAHTLTHPVLSKCAPDVAWKEISESRTRLEAVLQNPVWAMAYPFGHSESVTPKLLNMAKDAGYKAAFVNFGGGLGSALPLYALPRIHISTGMGFAEFEAHISGLYATLQRRAGRNGHPQVA